MATDPPRHPTDEELEAVRNTIQGPINREFMRLRAENARLRSEVERLRAIERAALAFDSAWLADPNQTNMETFDAHRALSAALAAPQGTERPR